MVAGVQEDWANVTKYTNLLSHCIPLSLIKFQILDPFSSVPIQIMRYFRHFDSLFFAPLWDLPAPIGNKSGSRDKIADQSRVGHVIQNSAQSQASTRMSWAWSRCLLEDKFEVFKFIMSQEQFTLNWHTYSDHLKDLMQNLMQSNKSSDVTIVCEDKTRFKVHKFVLNACSLVFQSANLIH